MRNYYPNDIHNKCVNGIVGTYEMSFLQRLYKRNDVDVIERKRFMGKDRKGQLLETMTAECGKCVHAKCEINAYTQVSCREFSSASFISVLFVLSICLLLL